MNREFWSVVAIAAAAAAGLAVLGGTVHDAIRYGLAVATGGLFGLGLARRRR